MEDKNLLLNYKKIIFSLLLGVLLISIWRGIWGLIDEYFFPSNYKLSLFIPLLLGILILFLSPKLLDELG